MLFIGEVKLLKKNVVTLKGRSCAIHSVVSAIDLETEYTTFHSHCAYDHDSGSLEKSVQSKAKRGSSR